MNLQNILRILHVTHMGQVNVILTGRRNDENHLGLTVYALRSVQVYVYTCIGVFQQN